MVKQSKHVGLLSELGQKPVSWFWNFPILSISSCSQKDLAPSFLLQQIGIALSRPRACPSWATWQARDRVIDSLLCPPLRAHIGLCCSYFSRIKYLMWGWHGLQRNASVEWHLPTPFDSHYLLFSCPGTYSFQALIDSRILMKWLFLCYVQGYLTLAVSRNKEAREVFVGLSVNICLPKYRLINLNSILI